MTATTATENRSHIWGEALEVDDFKMEIVCDGKPKLGVIKAEGDIEPVCSVVVKEAPGMLLWGSVVWAEPAKVKDSPRQL